MKKGFSSAVTIVLLLLLTISLVSVVGVFINPTLKQVYGIDNSEKANIWVETSNGQTLYDSVTKIACIQIARGVDKANLSAVQVIFLIEGVSTSFLVPPPEKNETTPDWNNVKTYCFNLSEYGVPGSVSIAPIYKNNNYGEVLSESSLPLGKVENVSVYNRGSGGGGGSGSSGGSSGGDGNDERSNESRVFVPAWKTNKIKAAWGGWKMNYTQVKLAGDNGFNYLLSGINFQVCQNTILTPELISLANSTRIENMSFVPITTFANRWYYENSDLVECGFPTRYNNRGVYLNGTKLYDSVRVPPLDRAYWARLTQIIVDLANLSATNGSFRSMKGFLLDMELYDLEYPDGTMKLFNSQEQFYQFTHDGSYDDETFGEFIINKSLQSQDPPTSNERRLERYDWLNSRNLLADYRLFVANKAYELAKNMSDQVYAVNKDFFITTYQSPIWHPKSQEKGPLSSSNGYLYPMYFDFYKGWSANDNYILFGTEMYGGEGSSVVPGYLLEDNHFSYHRRDTGENITLYYAGGVEAATYCPYNCTSNFSEVLKVAQKTNGYWIWQIAPSLMGDLTKISSLSYTIKTRCGIDNRNPGCCFNQASLYYGAKWTFANWTNDCSQYYSDAVTEYWKAINETNSAL